MATAIPKVQRLSSSIDEEKFFLEREKFELEKQRLDVSKKTHRWKIIACLIAALALFNFLLSDLSGDIIKITTDNLNRFRCRYLKQCDTPKFNVKLPSVRNDKSSNNYNQKITITSTRNTLKNNLSKSKHEVEYYAEDNSPQNIEQLQNQNIPLPKTKENYTQRNNLPVQTNLTPIRGEHSRTQ